MANKAIFLDKDGTLVEDVPYNVDPDLIRLCAGAVEAVRSLFLLGYQIFVITNQSGVALGYFSESALLGVQQCLRDLLAEGGVTLTGFYYCPHYPDGSPYAIRCGCRKPQPGLILQAAADHRIDLSQSWFIGDILNDVEAGRAAGCRTVLIDNGNETEWELSCERLPHHIVANLGEAARVIEAIDGVNKHKII